MSHLRNGKHLDYCIAIPDAVFQITEPKANEGDPKPLVTKNCVGN